MGTFTASKIQTASKEFECRHCGGTIRKGEQYLRYAAGLKNRYPICLRDAIHARGTWPPDDPWRKYDCAAVRQFVEDYDALGPGVGA